MARYAAVVSIKLTIDRLLNSSKVSFLPSCKKIFEFAYKELMSLQQVFGKLEEQLLNNSRNQAVNALIRQIREAVRKSEDSPESHVSDQVFSQSESLGVGRSLMLSPDIEEQKMVGSSDKLYEIKYMITEFLIRQLKSSPIIGMACIVGPEHQLRKVLLNDKSHTEGEWILVEDLYARLKDDIWSKRDWDELRGLLPKEYNVGCEIKIKREIDKNGG
ncbi:hypothetical protein CDL12_29079 [Handroanthus impetiginosus]|uniref:Uncharacterized protein n=1 Tax=Handroanthus impetiginosus TaxID=429701 RepID=A0A2G9FZG7_9LAMI|nr:hypothetical protein CDL12_29079 [Handroanthus impetiginosus]